MSNKIDQKVEGVDNTAIALITAEYATLREETIKRIELGHQLIALTLVVVGTFLSVGLQPGISASVLLVYPLLAMFLAAGWAHNDLRVRQITAYIIKIEEEMGNKPVGLRWVHFLMGIRPRVGFSRVLGVLSASGFPDYSTYRLITRIAEGDFHTNRGGTFYNRRNCDHLDFHHVARFGRLEITH